MTRGYFSWISDGTRSYLLVGFSVLAMAFLILTSIWSICFWYAAVVRRRRATDGFVDVLLLVGVALLVVQQDELLLEELVVSVLAWTHVELGVREQLMRTERNQRVLADLASREITFGLLKCSLGALVSEIEFRCLPSQASRFRANMSTIIDSRIKANC